MGNAMVTVWGSRVHTPKVDRSRCHLGLASSPLCDLEPVTSLSLTQVPCRGRAQTALAWPVVMRLAQGVSSGTLAMAMYHYFSGETQAWL